MFMNRVQTVTQKHYRVKNLDQNPNWLHEPPTGPASAPGAPRRACVRVVANPTPYRGRAARPYLSLRLSCRGAPAAVSQPHAARPRAPNLACPLTPCALCRAPLGALPRACRRPNRRIVAECCVRQRRVVGVRARSCARSAARLATEAHCIVIQLPSCLATLVTIQNFVLQPNCPQPCLSACNTLTVLQYSSKPKHHLAIQFPQPSLLLLAIQLQYYNTNFFFFFNITGQ